MMVMTMVIMMMMMTKASMTTMIMTMIVIVTMAMTMIVIVIRSIMRMGAAMGVDSILIPLTPKSKESAEGLRAAEEGIEAVASLWNQWLRSRNKGGKKPGKS